MAKESKKNKTTQKKSPKNKVEKKEIVEKEPKKEEFEIKSKKKNEESKVKVEKKEVEAAKRSNTLQTAFVGLLIILLFVLVGITAYKEVSKYLDSKKFMEQFNEIYESKEATVIFYSATGCSFCELEQPILDQIAEDYEFTYFEVDYTKLTESQHNEVKEKLGVDSSTPVTLIVQDGKVRAKQVGYVDGYKYVQFFVKSEFLPEGSTYKPEENLTFISYDEFKEIAKSEEPQVVVIGGATCSFCTTAKPILSNLANAYDIEINYITLDYFSADERLFFTEDLEDYGYDEETFVNEGKFNTPSVLIIKDKKVVSYEVGLGNITSYTKLFKDTGVIKK